MFFSIFFFFLKLHDKNNSWKNVSQKYCFTLSQTWQKQFLKKKKRKSPLKNIFLISFSLISLGNVFSVFLEMEKVSPEYFFLFVLENKKKTILKKSIRKYVFQFLTDMAKKFSWHWKKCKSRNNSLNFFIFFFVNFFRHGKLFSHFVWDVKKNSEKKYPELFYHFSHEKTIPIKSPRIIFFHVVSDITKNPEKLTRKQKKKVLKIF